eukprot:scaffold147291_cov59-Attheya_sp.AAC.1
MKLQQDGDLTRYLDLERGGCLKKYRLRNEVADYKFPFEYYVEFFLGTRNCSMTLRRQSLFFPLTKAMLY